MVAVAYAASVQRAPPVCQVSASLGATTPARVSSVVKMGAEAHAAYAVDPSSVKTASVSTARAALRTALESNVEATDVAEHAVNVAETCSAKMAYVWTIHAHLTVKTSSVVRTAVAAPVVPAWVTHGARAAYALEGPAHRAAQASNAATMAVAEPAAAVRQARVAEPEANVRVVETQDRARV